MQNPAWPFADEAYGLAAGVPASDSEAARRARELLSQWLSAAQLAQFEEHGYFDVVGCDSGAAYRIRPGDMIEEIGGRKWCVYPEGNLAAGDVMLAQKIALETSECKTLKIANRS